MSEVSELHKVYIESSSKSDHFMLGAIAAACAYLAQSNPYGRIGFNAETLFLIDLIVLGFAALFAYRKIEHTINVLKFNAQFLQGHSSGDEETYVHFRTLAGQYADKTSTDHALRNLFMALGFILYVAAKVWRVY